MNFTQTGNPSLLVNNPILSTVPRAQADICLLLLSFVFPMALW